MRIHLVMLQDILTSALKATEYLKSVNHEQYISRFIHDYDTFHLSVRETDIYQHIGKHMSDVVQEKPQVRYCPYLMTVHGPPVMVPHAHHIQMDIFHDALTLDDTFDIVLIDIEPHGREIQVYEKINES